MLTSMATSMMMSVTVAMATMGATIVAPVVTSVLAIVIVTGRARVVLPTSSSGVISDLAWGTAHVLSLTV